MVWWVPASAHAGGTNGARWRTDLELHNAGSTAASYTVELLRRDNENLSPDSRSFSLSPQQSVRYIDLLDSVFGFSGAASLRITTSSSLLFVTSCTYNLIDVNPWNLSVGSSFGQFVPAFLDGQAIATGQEGRLIHLTQRDSASLTGFRTNIGIVNATASLLDVTIDLYRADGTYLGTKQGTDTRLRAYDFRQLDQVFRAWGTVDDGYAVVKPATPGGRLLTFATVMDNHNSGDPVFIPPFVLTASGGPSPTPTPTVTPTPTPTPTPGSTIQLLPPTLAAPLLPGVTASLQVLVAQSTGKPLTFSLAEGPSGATIDAAITVTLPARLVPSGSQPQDLRLYVFTDHATSMATPFWLCTWNNLDVRPDHSVTMSLGELGDLYFIGLEPPGNDGLPAATHTPEPKFLMAGPLAISVICQGKLLAAGVPDLRQQVCEVTGDTLMTITVKNFWRRQWQPTATIEEMVGWIAAARQKYTSWGMLTKPIFEVIVEPMPQPTWLGFADGAQNYNVLHLDSSARTHDQMQTTTAHEFFHHAQSKTRRAGLVNLIRNPDIDWIVEGTARWAEDKIFTGVDADLTGDPTAIRYVAGKLISAAWACDFGSGFGAANKATLASAMLYYIHATEMMNDIRRLDPNDSPFTFAPTSITKVTPAVCPPATGCPATAVQSGFIPAKTAWEIEVNAVAGLPFDKDGYLEVEIGTPPVWVWIGDDDQHQELGQGTWFNTTGAPVTLRAKLASNGKFDVTSDYPDNLMVTRPCVNWRSVAKGKVTAPPGIDVSTSINPLTPYNIAVIVTGKNIARGSTITVEGTFDAYPLNPAGTCTLGGVGGTLTWNYFNEAFKQHSFGTETPTSSFKWVLDISSSSPLFTSGSVQVYWDLTYEKRHPDGSLDYGNERLGFNYANLLVNIDMNSP